MNLFGKRFWAVAVTLSLSQFAGAGDCPCKKSASQIHLTSGVDAGYLPPAPTPITGGTVYGNSVSVSSPTTQMGSYVVTSPAMTWNRSGVAMPPPGPLGQTYLRRTALVPDDEHPRAGVVLVHLPEQADVSSRGMKVKWTGQVWRMETEQAMIPGVPHIYAIKAEFDSPAGKSVQVRWVRLVMGREVDLEF